MKPPAINTNTFACPHCGAFTSHRWVGLYGTEFDKGKLPHIPTKGSIQDLKAEALAEGREIPQSFLDWAESMLTRLVFSEAEADSVFLREKVWNLNLSQCFACDEFSVWVSDRLIFPGGMIGPNPNGHLPSDITATFSEARRIGNESPRGAAALLRLCVQMLCAHLGEKGKNIDDDIASLVAKGLSQTVQKSLDIVRVIGNEAVHPGTIDIKDDRDTAAALFELVNAIAEQMIAHPHKVNSLYAKLPESKRQAIEKRDKKKSP